MKARAGSSVSDHPEVTKRAFDGRPLVGRTWVLSPDYIDTVRRDAFCQPVISHYVGDPAGLSRKAVSSHDALTNFSVGCHEHLPPFGWKESMARQRVVLVHLATLFFGSHLYMRKLRSTQLRNHYYGKGCTESPAAFAASLYSWASSFGTVTSGAPIHSSPFGVLAEKIVSV